MTSAGYSGTPLAKKLGIKPATTLAVIRAPDGFVSTLQPLPDDVEVRRSQGDADLFIVFGQWSREIDTDFHEAMARVPPEGAIWVAWPKRSSGVETDITEDTLRELFLPTGMVDNKVCAIDEVWSGLRFVVRKENRPEWGSGEADQT